MPTIETVRKALMTELQREAPDLEKILALSADLVESDPDHVWFRVDASHVERLGQELVSRKELALAELIKNSYDADAHNVTVTFTDSDISISDDGIGMTRAELVEGFMRLSTPMKVDVPRSPVLHRDRAGSKGIGRFAAQRLGARLTVDTKPRKGGSAIAIDINWDRFDKHKDLTAIPSPLRRGSRGKPGTTLTISRIRDSWNKAAIDEALLFIGPLVQPFSLGTSNRTNNLTASDFQVILRGGTASDATGSDGLTAHDVLRPLYDLAVAEITGWVDERGRARVSVESRQLGLIARDAYVRVDDNALFTELSDVRLKAYYYIRKRPWLPAGPEGSVLREALSRQGGIRLYRNGFRVHPYGERNNDWLKLDQGYALRETLLQAYGNQNFLGFIEVQDRTGERFQETASREGLLRTPAVEQLEVFGAETLRDAVRLVNASAAKKVRDLAGDIPSGKRVTDRLRGAEKTVAAVRTARGKQKTELLDKLVTDLRQARLDVNRIEKRYIHELGMLRVLATLGITVAEFVHEMRNTIVFLLSNITGLGKHAKTASAKEDFEDLQTNLKRLRAYTDYFHQAIVDNEKRELEALEVRKTLTYFRKFASPLTESLGINIATSVNGGRDLHTVEMHESEFTSILLNLLSNSIKAINRARRQEGIIQIHAFGTNDDVVILFSDNGDGIERERWERVFDAFESTTALPLPRSGKHEQLAGMGLGLKIVRDIVAGRGGSARVVEPAENLATTIRITLPRSPSQS
jgi:signal transduction histidine kinase